MHYYDVIFFDTIGMPYTSSTPTQSGLGGSEFAAIQVAEGLAAHGLKVLVMNTTSKHVIENDVEYCSYYDTSRALRCKTLLVQRYSRLITPIHYERLVCATSDMPNNSYDHKNLVCVSNWQRSLFPTSQHATVISNPLPALEKRAKIPGKFIYASAALKGLAETERMWMKLRPHGATLHVCIPGYDRRDDSPVPEGIVIEGSLPFHELGRHMAEAEGLFYVNVFPETFCIVAAMAEALGCRVHILCRGDVGGLREAVSSPLITQDEQVFEAQFRESYGSTDTTDPRWYGTPKDFSMKSILPQWLEVLGLENAQVHPKAVVSTPQADPVKLADQTFVVSLRRRKDRRQHFAHQAASNLQDWSFFDAFDGPTMGLSTAHGQSGRKRRGQLDPMSAGEVGCYLSHLSIIRAAIAMNLSSIAVIEDDIAFVDNFPTRWQRFIDHVPNDWEALHLGVPSMGHSISPQPINDVVHRLVGGTWGMYFLVLRRSAIQVFSEHLQADTMSCPIDQLLCDIERQVPIYGPIESLITLPAMGSDND